MCNAHIPFAGAGARAPSRKRGARALDGLVAFVALILAVGLLLSTASAAESTPRAATLPADWRGRLASDDLLEVIETLWVIAEAGHAASDAEDAVAGLHTETALGKILSRWCYHALTRMSQKPERYRGRYVAAAGWLHYNVVPPGEVGIIAGGPAPDMIGPELPEELLAPSSAAWTTCVDAVIRLLRAGDRSARDCLESMGAPEDVMVPRLAQVLLDHAAPSDARRTAAHLIGRYGHSTEAMKPLVKGLKDADPAVRGSCARAVGELSHPYDFYGSTYGASKHPSPEGAVVALVGALQDTDAGVRGRAAIGLRDMGHQASGAVRALTELVRGEPDGRARYSAILATGRIGYRLSRFDPEKLTVAAEAAVPALVDILRVERTRETAQLVQKAATSLGRFGEAAAAAVPELHRVLRSATGSVRDQGLRTMVVQSLGQIGPASAAAVPDIVACAGHSRFCRQVVAIALGKIGRGGADVEKVLLQLLSERDPWVRASAARSLAVVAGESEEVLDALDRLLDDEDEDVREESAKAIPAIRARAMGVEPEHVEDIF